MSISPNAYNYLHRLLRELYPKTGLCEKCGIRPGRRTEYALIAEEYTLIRKDYMELCARCHRRMDLKSDLDAPLCDCHEMPMNKNGRHPGGNQKWRCSPAQNERQRRDRGEGEQYVV